MDIINFFISLFSNSFVLMIISFVIGWMLRPLKRKDEIIAKGLPQIYSCVIRRNEDIENIKKLIRLSTFIYKGTFIDEINNNDNHTKNLGIKSQLILEKLEAENIKDFDEKMFFIYIENSMERNISIKDIINANNVKTVFYNSDIKHFEPTASGCIIIKDAERPTQLNIDIDGALISYKITEREGYIAPNVSRL